MVNVLVFSAHCRVARNLRISGPGIPNLGYFSISGIVHLHCSITVTAGTFIQN